MESLSELSLKQLEIKLKEKQGEAIISLGKNIEDNWMEMLYITLEVSELQELVIGKQYEEINMLKSKLNYSEVK